jgi:hypothetical protein
MAFSARCVELLHAVAREIDACRTLKDCISEQRAAVVSRDAERIRTANAALDMALEGLSQAAARRAELMAEGEGARGETEAGEIEQLKAEELQHARATLRSLCQDLRREAVLNREIISDQLAYMQTVLQALSAPNETYGPVGGRTRGDGLGVGRWG